jgi:hypothetical protein
MLDFDLRPARKASSHSISPLTKCKFISCSKVCQMAQNAMLREGVATLVIALGSSTL